MIAEYLGVLIILATALLVLGGLLGIHLLGARRLAEKQEPIACGESRVLSSRQHSAVKFYLVAILFVVFDVAAIYFYSWGATFREVGLPGLVAMTVFTVPLVIALIYEWRKGALEW